MLKEISIVPAVLVNNSSDYQRQIERINTFARRVQIDLSDGTFAPSETVNNIWWPRGWQVDLHLMAAKPSFYLDVIKKLSPSLCILHAEADEDLMPIFDELKSSNIKAGVALLKSTFPGNVRHYIEAADHVLIFAGTLGAQGGPADLLQMEKIPMIRNIKAEVELGWDGGANLSNIRALAHSGLDVINVGAALATADNPASVFEQMIAEIDKPGVAL